MVQSQKSSGLGRFLHRSNQNKPRRPRPKSETERRRRFLIVSLIVVAIISAVSIVGYGYYDTNVKPWRQPVLKVNATTFDMRYFVTVLRVQQLTTADYASYAIPIIKENELKRQYLESELGITVSEEAVNDKLREELTSAYEDNGELSENATEADYQAVYKKWADSIKSRGYSDKDVKELIIRPMLVEEELRNAIRDRDYPSSNNFEHAQVQALSVNSSDNATLLRTKWENAVPFEELTKEASVSSSIKPASDNGEAVWVAKGTKDTSFDNYTFAAPYGLLSDPIENGETAGTFWILNVLARESKPLSESDRDTLTSAALSSWLQEAENSPENEIVNYVESDPALLSWAIEHAAVDSGSET